MFHSVGQSGAEEKLGPAEDWQHKVLSTKQVGVRVCVFMWEHSGTPHKMLKQINSTILVTYKHIHIHCQ